MDRSILGQIRRMIEPVAARVANVAARAVISRISDAEKLQLLQIGVLADETIDGAERLQEYGFTSVPLAGAEAVALFPNGDRGHPLVIATDDRRHRVTGLAAGEVAIYSSSGARVILRSSGDVDVVAGSGGTVRLGSGAASDPIALKSDIDDIKSAISGATPTAGDGGLALKGAILAGWPVAPGASKVTGE